MEVWRLSFSGQLEPFRWAYPWNRASEGPGALRTKDLKQVTVATTVQLNAVTFPRPTPSSCTGEQRAQAACAPARDQAAAILCAHRLRAAMVGGYAYAKH